jgi:hypothetical protein
LVISDSDPREYPLDDLPLGIRARLLNSGRKATDKLEGLERGHVGGRRCIVPPSLLFGNIDKRLVSEPFVAEPVPVHLQGALPAEGKLPARRLCLHVVVISTGGATEADHGLSDVLMGRDGDVKLPQELEDLPFDNLSMEPVAIDVDPNL